MQPPEYLMLINRSLDLNHDIEFSPTADGEHKSFNLVCMNGQTFSSHKKWI